MGDWLERIRAENPERARAIERREARNHREYERRQSRLDLVREDTALLLLCPFRAESVRGIEIGLLWGKRCFLCGSALRDPSVVKQSRRLRWCSDACSRAWWTNHLWSAASAACLSRDRGTCVRCGSTSLPEANHKEPLNGRGYHESCAHHLAGLETLCHACHVAETNQQARDRRIAARPVFD